MVFSAAHYRQNTGVLNLKRCRTHLSMEPRPSPDATDGRVQKLHSLKRSLLCQFYMHSGAEIAPAALVGVYVNVMRCQLVLV